MTAGPTSSPERRPLRTDTTLPISTPGARPAPPPWVRLLGMGAAAAAPSAEARAPESGGPTSVTRLVETIWSGDGGGQGGRPLDETLSSLGTAYVEGNRVVVELPEELDPTYADYLQASLAQLNRLIEEGVMQVDSEGNLQPTALEVPSEDGAGTSDA
jgi:hypothetical protein